MSSASMRGIFSVPIEEDFRVVVGDDVSAAWRGIRGDAFVCSGVLAMRSKKRLGRELWFASKVVLFVTIVVVVVFGANA